MKITQIRTTAGKDRVLLEIEMQLRSIQKLRLKSQRAASLYDDLLQPQRSQRQALARRTQPEE